MKDNNMKTVSTYSVGRRVVNEDGTQSIERQERQVAVTLTTTEDKRVFWKGARVA
jgi:hypothetical protein